MTVELLGIDPRCLSTVKLRPIYPLPHISRRALKRVKDRVAKPTVCPHCLGPVSLVSNSAIYRGKEYGKWPYAYLCGGCKAYVGLHPDTDLPLGVVADAYTREARNTAKQPFMTLVRAVFKHDRNAAYAWLSKATGIEPQQCHFAFMDEETAMRVYAVCFNELFEANLDTSKESKENVGS